MARPTRIDEQTILAAAREVFLERGIQATSAEVAARAGVSEGSIFNRFKTKTDLFRAALEPEMGDPPFVRFLEEKVGRGDLRENLCEGGTRALAFFRQMLPMRIMLWSNPGALPDPFDAPVPPPMKAIQRLTAFFVAEMQLGRVRTGDPLLLARVFLGALISHVFFQTVLGAKAGPPSADEVFVRGVVDWIWGGIAPVE